LHYVNQRSRIHRTIFLCTVSLLVSVLPFSFAHPLLSLCFRIFLVALIVNWITEPGLLTRLSGLKQQKAIWLFALFYLLHVVALIYTTNIKHGLFQLEKKSFLVVLPVIVLSSAPISRSEFAVILKTFLASVILASFICFGVAFHRNNYWETFEYPDWYYFSYNDFTEVLKIQPNYLAIFTCFSIFILLRFWIENKSIYSRKKTFLLFLGVGYFFFLLLLLSGRTPILTLALIIFTATGYYFYKQKKLLKGIAIIALLSIAAVIAIFQVPIVKERLLQTFGLANETTWISHMGDGKGGLPSVRLQKWSVAITIIQAEPLLGVGVGDVQDSLQEEYKRTGFDLAYNAQYNAHNQFLQTWLGIGIAGLLVLLACFGMLAKQAIASRDPFFLAFLVLFFFCSITESTLERQFGIFFFAMFSALLLSHITARKSQQITF
jgi:O-antigen ligase